LIIFTAQNIVNKLPNINQNKLTPLIFAEQITLPNNDPISWIFYKQLNNLSPKGRTAKWFNRISQWISNNRTIIQNKTTSVATYIDDCFPHPTEAVKTTNRRYAILWNRKGELIMGKLTSKNSTKFTN
jgi:hypothetical protein